MPVTAASFGVSAGQVLHPASGSPVLGTGTGISIAQTVSPLRDTVRVSEQIGMTPAPSIPVTAPAILQTPEQALHRMCERYPYQTARDEMRDLLKFAGVSFILDAGAAACVYALNVSSLSSLDSHPILATFAFYGGQFLLLTGAIATGITSLGIRTVWRYFQTPEPDGHVYESQGRFITDEPRPIDKVNAVEAIERASQIQEGRNVFTNAFVVEQVSALPKYKGIPKTWLLAGCLGGERVQVFAVNMEQLEIQPGQVVSIYGRGANDGSVRNALVFTNEA